MTSTITPPQLKRVVAGILQRPDGKILLLHRANDRQQEPGEWCVVSGHVKAGETPKAAMIREISEELVGSQVGQPVWVGKAFVLESEREAAVIYPFLFQAPQQMKVVIESEHQDFCWVKPEQIGSYPIVAQLRQDLVHVGLLPRKCILGVVGRNAAGKDTLVTRLHEKYGLHTLNISDQVRAIAHERGVPLTRENLHAISAEHMAKDPEYFSKRTLQHIEAQTSRVVAVSGFRTADNVRTFRRYYGDEFILVQINAASEAARFERMQKRHEAKDPLSWEHFVRQERDEERIFHVSQTLDLAEICIVNNGSRSQFLAAIDQFGRVLQ